MAGHKFSRFRDLVASRQQTPPCMPDKFNPKPHPGSATVTLSRGLLRGSCLLALSLLTGCGTYVPAIQEIWDQPEGSLDAGGALEKNIKEKVYCELKRAVQSATTDRDVIIYRDNKKIAALPDDWGIQMTLSLQVDEGGALNPGASLITPMHAGITNFAGEFLAPGGSLLSTMTYPFVSTPQSYTLGLGGTLSSQATRIDKFMSYYDVGKLKIDLGRQDQCNYDPNGDPQLTKKHGSSFLLESDLGINQWLLNALTVNTFYPSTPLAPTTDAAFKQDILSYEVKFVVTSTGNVTPTWKLVRVATNNGNLPLASLNRVRSHDLLITFGPSQKPTANRDKSGSSAPSRAAADAHLASQIGLSVANNLRNLLPP
jgi:hypothetical protein